MDYGTREEWTWYSVSGVAPDGVEYVRVLMRYEGSSGDGMFLWDDAELTAREPVPGGTVTFDVMFTPTEDGLREAIVYITNNVSGKSPYTFALHGRGVGPEAMDLIVNAGEDVTDAQVRTGQFPIALAIEHAGGVETTNTLAPYFIPRFDIYNSVGTLIVSNYPFTAFTYTNDGTRVVAESPYHSAVDMENVTLGIYTMRWSAVASNGIATIGSPYVAGEYHETFDNSPLSGTAYADGSFTGNDGIVWHYQEAREEGDYPIDGAGMILRANNPARIYSETLPDGVGYVSVQVRKAFTAAGARKAELLVNEEVVAESPSFGNFSGADDTVYTLYAEVNQPGEVVIEVREASGVTSSRHLTVDNIQWSSYPGHIATFTVIDDDTEPPLLGDASAVNLLDNPSFEYGTGQGTALDEPPADVDHWAHWGEGWWAADHVHHGDWEIKRWSAGQGMYQDFDTYPGRTYNFSLWAFDNDGEALSEDAHLELCVEWFDAGYAPIGGAIVIDSLSGGGPTDTWIELSGLQSAPDDARYGRFLIRTVEDGPGPWSGAVYYDNSSLIRMDALDQAPLSVRIGDRYVVGSDDTTNAVFTITDGELASLAGGVGLLENPGFETGEWDEADWDYFGPSTEKFDNNWFYTSPTVMGFAPHHGEWAVGHTVMDNDRTGDEADLWRAVYQQVAAEPGEAYHASVYLRAEGVWNSSAFLEVKFLDEFGEVIIPEGKTAEDPEYKSEEVHASQDYTLLEVRDAVAPTNAVTVQVAGVVYAPAGEGPNEHFIFDDMSLRRGPTLTLFLNAYDPISGLSRGTDPENPNLSHLSIGTWIEQNVENYAPYLSSADSTVPTAISAWEFGEPPSGALLQAMFDADKIPITASFSDADFDRIDDNLWLENQQFGYLQLIDDDTNPPTVGPRGLTVMIGETVIPPMLDDAELLAGWNFNDPEARLEVSHGDGTLTHNLTGEPGFTFTGTDINLVEGDEAGNDMAVSGTGNIGNWIQFEIDKAVQQGLIMSFAGRRSAAGYDNNTVSYSVNGGDFVVFDDEWVPHTDWRYEEFDFSNEADITEANSVVIRITFGTNNVTGGGNNRFDNFQFNAGAIVYEITDAQLASVSETNMLTFSFNVYDEDSGLFRGTEPLGGTNMHINIPGLATNDTERFRADLSSLYTREPTSTSVWAFAEIGYEWRGALYHDGTVLREIELTASDRDVDRPDDNLWLEDYRFGYLRIVDDDPYPPVAGPLTILHEGEAITAMAGEVELLAGWNFNQTNVVVSHGSGEMTYDLEGTINWHGGSTVNAVGDDPAGVAFSPEHAGNVGGYLQFEVNMSAHADLEMSFAVRRTTQGYDRNQVSWSVDGEIFTDFGEPFNPTTSTTLERKEFDFSSVQELNGAPRVVIRITLDVDEASGSGNNRYDNVQFNARRTVYQITDAQLAAVSAMSPMDFSFNVYDQISGIYRGPEFNGLNMHVTIPGVTTNDTERYQPPAISSADTTIPTSTSVWRFIEFEYEHIGALYGDGTNYVDIMATLSDMDDDRPDDNMWVSNHIFGVMHVIDDDTEPPFLVNRAMPGANPRSFWVLTNGAPLDSSRRLNQGTDTRWTVTDGELANPEEHGLQFMFIMQDEGSGISRFGEWGRGVDSNTVINFSVGDLPDLLYGPDWNLDLSASSLNVTNAVVTNVWTFAAGHFGFPPSQQVGDFYEAGTQPVRITLVDDDDDRPNDQAIEQLVQAGLLRVIDDDTDPPLMGPLTLNHAETPHNLFVMNFDAFHGWTNIASATSYLTRTNRVGDDLWIGENMNVSVSPSPPLPPIGRRMSGSRAAGFQLEEDHGRLQMPERENLGALFLWANLSGAGSRSLVVEGTTNGVDWAYNFGTNVVDITDEFMLLTWDINHPGPMVLRLRPGDANDRTIYFDDITLIERGGWTNVSDLDVSFDNAVDESGIYAYRALVDTIPDFQRGSNIAQTGFVPLATNHASVVGIAEGIVTGFIYAVDADMDRPNDQLRNAGIPYIARIDRTPPAQIQGLRASDDGLLDEQVVPGLDPASEIYLEWEPLEDGGGTEIAGYGYHPLSPHRSYMIFYAEERDPTLEDDFIWVDHGYDSLGDITTTNTVISNLVFGTTYHLAIAGVDEAGNIGPLSHPPQQAHVPRFHLTQGVARATAEVELYWTASPGREYDLISADSWGFHSGVTNLWEIVGYGVTNMLGDTRTINVGDLRFYRAAQSERWRKEKDPRLASEEVYVRKDYRLHPGENWIQLPGIPDTNTVEYIFGTDLPAGVTAAGATIIRWMNRGPDPVGKTNELWLAYMGSSNAWLTATDPYELANDWLVDVKQGVEILIRGQQGDPPTLYTFIGRVPTNNSPRTVKGGSWGAGGQAMGGVVNLVSYNLPHPMHPRDLNLGEAKTDPESFAGSWGNVFMGDWLIVWNRQTQSATPYGYNLSTGRWEDFGGSPVTSRILRPGDAIMILRRMGRGDFPWSIEEFPYDNPTRFIHPM